MSQIEVPVLDRSKIMTRIAFLVYGAVCHLLFLAVYAWMGAFFAGIPWLPNSIDAPPRAPLGWALAINAGLVLAFALQHSVMARPGFKRLWTRIVPQPIERSTYVLLSCVVLAALMILWQPINIVVWDLPAGPATWAAWALFAIGWLMVPLVSLMINHFDLFGTRQVWLHWRGEAYTSLPFRTPHLYGRMRHPLYVGWAIAFWATPTMTAGHLLLAALLTGYMLVAVVFEERDLVAHFGETYENYRRRVPMFIPRFGKRANDSGELQTETETQAA
jgi:protein-S-isoprenylcysteine O-methyltransferase Ste14